MVEITNDSKTGVKGEKGYPLPVEKHTELPEPIKVSWRQSTRTHAKMVHSLNSNFADANSNEPFIGCGVRAMTRQKTQLVVKTEEEAESLLYELDQYCSPYGLDAPHGVSNDAYQRVRSELEAELEELGYEVDRSEFRPELVADRRYD